MLEHVQRLQGEPVAADAYRSEFRDIWQDLTGVFWKLERIQTFREPGDPSWESLAEGRWDDAIAYFETERSDVEDYFQKAAARGLESRRLRIIDQPVSPYLQWELHHLKIRAEYGERIRVLPGDKLGDLEAEGLLPELVILDTRVMFEVVYDATGTHSGARRFTARDVIDGCRAEMDVLYDQAEDLLPYFEREIAPLPPPPPDHG